ncbi:MAG: hypothetical protein Ct9H300mP11_24440 [Chloroflexota bacterium]|nr:MAG: hypothetical protein Ct9H300mP11_24440 [Chloroflexota bacterium]
MLFNRVTVQFRKGEDVVEAGRCCSAPRVLFTMDGRLKAAFTCPTGLLDLSLIIQLRLIVEFPLPKVDKRSGFGYTFGLPVWSTSIGLSSYSVDSERYGWNC